MKRLFLPGAAGQIEALMMAPLTPHAAALVCHPHPLQGGTMHTKAVYRVARGLGEAGCAVLRFNFRGVGHSAGSWDEERGEKIDAQTALDYLAQQHPQTPLLVGGFSFGSFMGLQVGMNHPQVHGLLGIGLPLDRYRFEFLNGNTKPLLLLSGAQDPFCPADELRQLADRLGQHVEVHILAGSGHLLLESLQEVQQIVEDFARRHLPAPSA
jgi:alpha/beta superfamily hydrolase